LNKEMKKPVEEGEGEGEGRVRDGDIFELGQRAKNMHITWEFC